MRVSHNPLTHLRNLLVVLKTSFSPNFTIANDGNPLSLISVPRTRTNPYLLWILAAVLAVTAVDSIPDPPAVNTHTVNVVSHLCDSGTNVCEQRFNTGWFCFSSHLHATRIAYTSASEPNLPRDFIVLTGQAADTSPPIPISQQL